MTKKDLLESFSSQSSNSREQESLNRVARACDYLDEHKAAITYSSVGDYCNNMWGGPKSQSIRNSKQCLKAFVDGRSQLQTISEGRHKKAVDPTDFSSADETTRAYISLLQTERDNERRQRQRIVSALKKIPGIPIDEIIQGRMEQEATTPPKTNWLSQNGKLAQQAISKLLDESLLAQVGLELHKGRLRCSTTKFTLLAHQEVEALQSLVTNQPEPPEST